MSTPTEITPNVVIRNPQVRLGLGIGLYLLSVLAGVSALVVAFFPEIAAGTDIPTRLIGLVNAVVSLVSGAFGLVVTVPNVPRPDASGLLRRDLR